MVTQSRTSHGAGDRGRQREVERGARAEGRECVRSSTKYSKRPRRSSRATSRAPERGKQRESYKATSYKLAVSKGTSSWRIEAPCTATLLDVLENLVPTLICGQIGTPFSYAYAFGFQSAGHSAWGGAINLLQRAGGRALGQYSDAPSPAAKPLIRSRQRCTCTLYRYLASRCR